MVGLISCNGSSEQKAKEVEDAKTELGEAMKDLDRARVDSANEYIAFKSECEIKLDENCRKIADLKSELKKEKKGIHDKYEKRLDDLDQKNSKLKVSIKEYKEGTKSRWEVFKNNFNHDMDELSQMLSGISEVKH